MKLKQAATLGLGTLVLTTGAVVAGPAAQAATYPCAAGSWCLYRDSNYRGGEIPTPGTRGRLPVPDYDKTSSVINNTGKRVCLYTFRGGGSSVADLVRTVKPYEDITMLKRFSENDRVDAYYSTTALGCQSVASF